MTESENERSVLNLAGISGRIKKPQLKGSLRRCLNCGKKFKIGTHTRQKFCTPRCGTEWNMSGHIR